MKKDWLMKKLGEVCEISSGKSNTEDAVENGDYAFFDRSKIVKRSSKYLFDSEAIIIAGEGQTFPPKFYSGKFDLHQRAYALFDFKNEISVHYVFNYLIHFQKYFENVAVGTTVKSLRLRHFQELPIPVPTIIEQQQIVSILDEAFAAIEQAKQNLQRNLQNAKDLSQSEKNQLFENLGKTAGKVPIASVCNEIFAGGDAPKGNFSDEKTEEYPIPIYANAVGRKGLYGFTDVSRVTEPSITIAGRGSGTGYTEIRYEPFFPIVRLIVLTPNIEKITLEFLKYAIQSLTILKSGSAIPQLTIPMIKGYSLPLPSLKEQKKIVYQFDTLEVETKNLENIYQQKLNALEELKKSILQKAFSGELTEKKTAVSA